MNPLKKYLQSIRQYASPKTRAFEQELDAIREAHARVSTDLEKARDELQRSHEEEAQLHAEMQLMMREIEPERAHMREQIEHLERSLADTELYLKSAEADVSSLETKLEVEGSRAREQLAQIERQLTDAEQHRKSTKGRMDALETRLKEEVSSARDQVADVQGTLADTEQRLKSTEGRMDALETRLKEEVSSAGDQVADVQGLLSDTEQRRKSTETRLDSLETRLDEKHSSTSEQVAQVQRMLASAEQHQKSTEFRVGSLETKLDEERSSLRDEVAQVQRLLADAEQRHKTAEAHVATLETRLDEQRGRHEASLHATETSLSRLQDEQQSLLRRLSDLTTDFQGIATGLQDLQQAPGGKPPQSRLMSAVITGVLLVTGVLAGVFIMQGLQDRSRELALVEQDIRDMRGFMKERIDRQDAALNDLAMTLNSQVTGERTPVVQILPTPETETQEADEQPPKGEPFTPDIPELQAALITLGFDLGIPGPNGELGVKTRQALQEFRQFYLVNNDPQDELITEPLVALLLKSADIARADAARFNVGRDVLAAIRLGSKRTGVDFSFLMELARVESNFNPAARAPGSSATGLFQFRDHAWLEAVRTFGAGYGLQDYARRVELVDDGDHEQDRIVRDPLQLEVLSLRLNPRLSTLMMAENIKRYLQILSERTGQEPGRIDLYLAHFLGPDGAVLFLKQLDEEPAAIAGDLFPQETESYPGVFLTPRQQPRTVADVYRRFERKFNTGRYDERNPG